LQQCHMTLNDKCVFVLFKWHHLNAPSKTTTITMAKG
jgi:hypothetical protein